MSKSGDLLDERLKVLLEELDKRYAPDRARLKFQMMESGVDTSSALGGTILADSLASQQKEASRLGAETAVQKVMLEREDALEEQRRKDIEDERKRQKRGMWANVIGTLGGAALSAIPGPGTLAAAGFKGVLGRFLGGAGGAIGGMAGGAIAGGGGSSGADSTLTADPEYQALRNQLTNLRLNKEGIPTERFGAKVPTSGPRGAYQFLGANPYEVTDEAEWDKIQNSGRGVQLNPDRWDEYYNEYSKRYGR